MGLAQKRQDEIRRLLERMGEVVISDLARRMRVSQMTVRRDLERLEARGLLLRVHGGAIAAGARFDQRLESNPAAKARAARKLERFLPTGGTIYLDGSTTMLNLVGRLKNRGHLVVVTNNPETFSRLHALPGVEAMLIGGRLDPRTDNLVGTLALRSVTALCFDAGFFSSFGLSARIGPTEATLEDAQVKEEAAGRCREIYLAVDASKLGRTYAGNWHPDPARTVLATSLAPDNRRLESFANLARKVV